MQISHRLAELNMSCVSAANNILRALPEIRSGALAAHYAPRTPLELVEPGRMASYARPGDAVLARSVQVAKLPEEVLWVAAASDVVTYGHDLYAHLRDLDAAGCSRILVEMPPASAEWSAVADRLGRAAVGSGEDDET